MEQPQPTRVRFPGNVRLVGAAVGARVMRNHDPKTGEHKTTTVTVPPGQRAKYECRPAAAAMVKDTYVVDFVPDTPLDVAHCELEHEHDVVETKHKMGSRKVRDEEGKWADEPIHIDLVTRTLKRITARGAEGTPYEGLVGEGDDAASAVADLQAKKRAKEAPPAPGDASPTPSADTKLGNVAGDEGDGEVGKAKPDERVVRQG